MADPGSWGDASSWDSHGLPVDSTPQIGDVAYFKGADHVAYVEGVGNGTVTVSESNWSGNWLDWRTISTSGLAFLHPWDGISRTPGAPISRYGALDAGGTLWVKEGNPNASWVAERTGVSGFALDANRIGTVSGGIVYVKQGALNAPWTTQYEQSATTPQPAAQISMDASRIAVVSTGGQLWVKDGGLGASWVHEYDNVAQVSMSMNRIGIRTTSGEVLVKEGALNASWLDEQVVATKISLTGNRIGFVSPSGAVLVKQGAVNAGWTTVWGSGATDIQMSGYRIGVNAGGSLQVKESTDLNGTWDGEYDGIAQFDLFNDQIGVTTSSGASEVKQGALNAGWTLEMTSVVKTMTTA